MNEESKKETCHCGKPAKWLSLEMGNGHPLYCEYCFIPFTGVWQYSEEGHTREGLSSKKSVLL